MIKPSDATSVSMRSIKTSQINRLCAVIAMLTFCILFAWRFPDFYAIKFEQVKSSIETHYAAPPKEPVLKQLFWYYLEITNRKYVNGNIIMNDGRLVAARVSDPPLLEKRAEVIIEFKDYLQVKDTPFLFLRAPDSMRDNTQMPKGFENTVLEDGARFLSILRENDVDTLDLREELTNDYTDWSKAFYWGDHHWNAETALWAFGKVGNLMNSKYGFHLNEKTWNPSEYEHIKFDKAFLGSASNQVGQIKEDITALIPKFHTEFIIADKLGGDKDEGLEILASGEFIDVFTPAAKYKNNNNFKYTDLNVFGSGPIRQYKNLAAQEHKKVLLISDSYAYPFVTYLATAIENVDYLYLENTENQKVYPILENESYDLVLFLVYDGILLSGRTDIETDRMYLGQRPD